MALGFVLAMAIAIPAAAQAPIPRTSDGHPDLQGTWSYATLTTLERPAEFKNKPVLTAAPSGGAHSRCQACQRIPSATTQSTTPLTSAARISTR